MYLRSFRVAWYACEKLGYVLHNHIYESMGHSVDSNITNRYIDAFPLAQQMEFNSRLLKLNDDAGIMEGLKGLTPEQLKALIAMVKNS